MGLLKLIAKTIAYTVAFFVALIMIGTFISLSNQNENTSSCAIGWIVSFIAGWVVSTKVKMAKTINTPEQSNIRIASNGNDNVDSFGNITYSEDARYKINYTDGDGNTSERVIRPIKIIRELDGEFYIDAFCELRGGKRTFRSSRIEQPIVDIETGEIVDLEMLPFSQVFEGLRGGRYIFDDKGKKRYL